MNYWLLILNLLQLFHNKNYEDVYEQHFDLENHNYFGLTDNLNYFSKEFHNFRHLILVQHWPQTSCYLLHRERDETQNNINCSFAKKNEWSIRGLWPAKYRTCEPDSTHCGTKLEFDESEIESFNQALNRNWNDVANQSSIELWRNEWKKYGSCVFKAEREDNIKHYFQLALELKARYDLNPILDSATIFPGRSWQINDYINVLRTKLGVVAKIQCVCNKSTNECYIHEVRLCIDHHRGEAVSCSTFGNCPSNAPILYPSIELNDINSLFCNNLIS